MHRLTDNWAIKTITTWRHNDIYEVTLFRKIRVNLRGGAFG